MVELISKCEHGLQLLDRLRTGFQGIHILVVGDVILDRHVYVESSRKRIYYQPLLNVLKYHSADESACAGGAGIIARTVAAYGASVDFCGVIGRDDEARVICNNLGSAGVDFHPVYAGDRPTSIVCRYLAKTGTGDCIEHVRIDRRSEDVISQQVAGRIIRKVRHLASNRRPHAVIIADFGRGVICEEVVKGIGNWMNKREIPVVLDPKGTLENVCDDEVIQLAAVFPTLKEAWDSLRIKDRAVWQSLGGTEDPPHWYAHDDYVPFVRAIPIYKE